MISVSEVRERATKRVQSKRGEWGADRLRPEPAGGAWRIALHPPTEAEVRSNEGAAERWVQEWRKLENEHANHGIAVTWAERVWKSIGRQTVPTHVAFSGPDAVAFLATPAARHDWETIRNRSDSICQRFRSSAALAQAFKGQAAAIRSLSEEDFATLLDVVAWLVVNDASGLRPRQLPIRGVDTKWFGAHRSVVIDLHSAITTEPIGIVESDKLIRVRVLDPSLMPGGIHDFAAPISQLNNQTFSPRFVFVFENLESVLSLPEWPGAIAVHGSGYSVGILERINWLRDARIIYWGDLDSHGFAILHRLRSHLPKVTSVLMDESTLLAYRDLWVLEPAPNRGSFNSLNDSEQLALLRVRNEGNVRLEQERIPWEIALAALRSATR